MELQSEKQHGNGVVSSREVSAKMLPLCASDSAALPPAGGERRPQSAAAGLQPTPESYEGVIESFRRPNFATLEAIRVPVASRPIFSESSDRTHSTHSAAKTKRAHEAMNASEHRDRRDEPIDARTARLSARSEYRTFASPYVDGSVESSKVYITSHAEGR
jgi:hypothetical protein